MRRSKRRAKAREGKRKKGDMTRKIVEKQMNDRRRRIKRKEKKRG